MIEIKNLTKRFQDFTALENVTCTIGSGCIYGMVGSKSERSGVQRDGSLFPGQWLQRNLVHRI